ncbi:hypothetical protein TNIN_372621 [Trichonephila inaurata madagascariensis]|uniref:Uncharacterized protein n=1 Tax=Trichonephila inaurata madagascariensis TaxID=2747483 RepID=A0A8X7CJY6_9ARAC|nr:hypothetical protein TNIN_372621 [Trichonephila inaurata madagascariensis]
MIKVIADETLCDTFTVQSFYSYTMVSKSFSDHEHYGWFCVVEFLEDEVVTPAWVIRYNWSLVVSIAGARGRHISLCTWDSNAVFSGVLANSVFGMTGNSFSVIAFGRVNRFSRFTFMKSGIYRRTPSGGFLRGGDVKSLLCLVVMGELGGVVFGVSWVYFCF